MSLGKCALAVLAVGLSFTDPTHGGAVAVSRESSLNAAGQITGDQFDLTDSSTTLGLYDNLLSDALTPTSGGTTSAEAAQRSSIPVEDATTIFAFAAGHASAQVAELDAIAASASSNFIGVFDVTDEALTLNIEGSISGTQDAQARVVLSNELNAAETFFSRVIDFGAPDTLTFDENLQLQPGRYRLTANAAANGTPQFNTATFDVDLRVSNGGGEPVPIPLPIGAWPGAIALAGAMAWARRPRGLKAPA